MANFIDNILKRFQYHRMIQTNIAIVADFQPSSFANIILPKLCMITLGPIFLIATRLCVKILGRIQIWLILWLLVVLTAMLCISISSPCHHQGSHTVITSWNILSPWVLENSLFLQFFKTSHGKVLLFVRHRLMNSWYHVFYLFCYHDFPIFMLCKFPPKYNKVQFREIWSPKS